MSGLNRSSSAAFKNGGLPPQELLDDLCSRFVLNVPKEDQQSFERILFLVEYAHWFYEDNSVEKNPSLKSFTLKEFTSLSILFYFLFLCFFFDLLIMLSILLYKF
jgi:mRNA-decapping enzyme subunit 2